MEIAHSSQHFTDLAKVRTLFQLSYSAQLLQLLHAPYSSRHCMFLSVVARWCHHWCISYQLNYWLRNNQKSRDCSLIDSMVTNMSKQSLTTTGCTLRNPWGFSRNPSCIQPNYRECKLHCMPLWSYLHNTPCLCYSSARAGLRPNWAGCCGPEKGLFFSTFRTDQEV